MECHLPYEITNQHRWKSPDLTAVTHASIRFTYPGGMKGCVDLGGWSYTEMVYLSKNSYLSR